jgi:lycopene cyclase domain-containing protein
MTYFGFLAQFLGIPLLILIALTLWDRARGNALPAQLHSWPARFVILAHVIMAVVYTTPWDNYLVATRVWWYDPQLVTGIVIGWVPIEEYTFFVLQSLAMGLLIVFLAKRLSLPNDPISQSPNHLLIRIIATSTVGVIWLISIVLLIAGWERGTYLTLILSWALIPVMIQFAVGADILWRYRTLVFWALVPATLYLCVADKLAIGSGTWTIDPAQSTGILIGGLPLEEAIFFLMTNILVVFGVVLVLARESQQRAPTALLRLIGQVAAPPNQVMRNA